MKYKYREGTISLKINKEQCKINQGGTVKVLQQRPAAFSLRSTLVFQLAYTPSPGWGLYWQTWNKTSCSWKPGFIQIESRAERKSEFTNLPPTEEVRLPLLTISVASVAPRRRDHMTKGQVNLASALIPSQWLTISDNNSSTPRDSTYTVDQYDSTACQCLMNELTGYWKVNQKICIFNVFDIDTLVAYTRLRNFCRNCFITHR